MKRTSLPLQRRAFISLLGGAAAAWPLAAHAEQPAMPVIGFPGSTPAGPYASIVAAVRRGLKETGFVEGQNLAIEYRWADNQLDRLPALAADLVSRKVAVIVTSGSVPVLTAKAATSTIPIVFHTGLDPVAAGLVSSMNRPGGNITDATFLTEASTLKRLSLLRDLVPTANVIGLLANRPEATDSVPKELETVTRPLGLALQTRHRNGGSAGRARPAPRLAILCVDVLGFLIGLEPSLELAHQRQQAGHAGDRFEQRP